MRALRAESGALVQLFRPLCCSSYGVWRSEMGGHAAPHPRKAEVVGGGRPYMCVQNWKSRKKKAATRAPTRI